MVYKIQCFSYGEVIFENQFTFKSVLYVMIANISSIILLLIKELQNVHYDVSTTLGALAPKYIL